MRWINWLLGKEWDQTLPKGKFSELRPEMLMGTLKKLSARIAERFPDAGLGKVCKELIELAEYGKHIYPRLFKPMWTLRIIIGTAIVILLTLVTLVGWSSAKNVSGELTTDWSNFLQGLESLINEMVFLSLAIFFLWSLETRYKRRLALRSLHSLRSLAHVVDMHQLTKDPAVILAGTSFKPTESSPTRLMTPYQLIRYLEYCSEMLSLTSKLAALHVQYLDDPVVLNAVNDIESLVQGLSNKIWQKIMILDLAEPENADKPPEG